MLEVAVVSVLDVAFVCDIVLTNDLNFAEITSQMTIQMTILVANVITPQECRI